jgi:predicted signal transduction protein with EAL and GGDEF domain
VVFVNVDSTLAIGRRLGWDTYEKVIREAARRLARAFGPDRVGRLTSGGFVVLRPGLTNTNALASASEVARVLRAAITVNDIPFAIEPVAGVALSPEHGRDFDVLAFRSQLAVGEARRAAASAAVYVKQSQDVADRRIALLAELRMALLDPSRRDEIGVVYQPQVQLRTRRLVGAEALVRWTHPDWGPVAPADLLDAVESSEVMPMLTWHMLDRVTAQVRAWSERGRFLRVAVNASMQDLNAADFPAQISEVLRRHDLPPDCLTIEITERLLVSDSPRVSQAAAEILRIGVGLSLDDFGTGYASIQQLRVLPLTEVKIDKSYVHDLTHNKAKRAIVKVCTSWPAASIWRWLRRVWRMRRRPGPSPGSPASSARAGTSAAQSQPRPSTSIGQTTRRGETRKLALSFVVTRVVSRRPISAGSPLPCASARVRPGRTATGGYAERQIVA